MQKWTERFQCLRGNPEDNDPVVQIFFKKSIEGHPIEGLEEHRVMLSKLPYLRELLDPEHVEKLEKEQSIPAADRIVTRSDNSKVFDEASEAISRVEKVLQETNQQIEGKDEAIEELSFTRKLMNRGRISLMVLGTLAIPVLVKLRDKIFDGVIDTAAKLALDKIAALIGWAMKLFMAGP